jgi:hypothetical protein
MGAIQVKVNQIPNLKIIRDWITNPLLLLQKIVINLILETQTLQESNGVTITPQPCILL